MVSGTKAESVWHKITLVASGFNTRSLNSTGPICLLSLVFHKYSYKRVKYLVDISASCTMDLNPKPRSIVLAAGMM